LHDRALRRCGPRPGRQGVFDNDIDPRRVKEFLADPRHHMAVALMDDQVVGMASAVHVTFRLVPDAATVAGSV
jgi:hypothetical protein